ncbi:sulfurtransferase complex subunit TusC [Simiduia curdlanivorans]|uniref:Sulfurtransferase complex subunit TusC n=1 Tax=Simiduia curdlanivorans TaxID=1492769 RepID=A0ABV8V9X7_9GAMM|nr:sulfurtransferase complex subunit TusC [Simiduia curdlanivorans]MDN3639725.1 sulfurtransferase complex subunit TusC [Simiduia curdlanivorans]
MKTTLFLFRHSPSAGDYAKEGLDALLATAAFEQKVIPVFIGDGVLQLNTGMALNNLNLPNIEKQLNALPLYDVETLYVHKPSFEQLGVATHSTNIHWLSDEGLCNLLEQADQVLTF